MGKKTLMAAEAARAAEVARAASSQSPAASAPRAAVQLSVSQFAGLLAELSYAGDNGAAVLDRYGLDPAAFAREQERMAQLFQSYPDQRTQFEQQLRYFRGIFRPQG